MLKLPDDCLLKARLMKFRDDDGYLHHLRYWKAQRQHKATILCLHGIQSHSGWYGYSCQKLAEAGYEVIFPDRRGSGLNLVERGHARSCGQLARDLEGHLRFVRKEFPLGAGEAPKPLVVLGLSWGGRLAVYAAREFLRKCGRMRGRGEASNLPEPRGLVLLYPGIETRFVPSGWQSLLLELLGRGPTAEVRRRIPTDAAELFTRTPEFMEYMRADGLTLRRATLSFFRVSGRLLRHAKRIDEKLPIPVLMMLSGRDEIVDNQATRDWLMRLDAAEKQLLEYPEARHTLEFEPDRDRFIQDLVSWLEARWGAAAGAGEVEVE